MKKMTKSKTKLDKIVCSNCGKVISEQTLMQKILSYPNHKEHFCSTKCEIQFNYNVGRMVGESEAFNKLVTKTESILNSIRGLNPDIQLEIMSRLRGAGF